MLISRGLNTVKLLKTISQNNNAIKQSVRNSGHDVYYRTGLGKPSRSIMLAAELFQGYAWWWVLWHLWTQPDHLTGEFPYPDPSQWTDEELGIPQD